MAMLTKILAIHQGFLLPLLGLPMGISSFKMSPKYVCQSISIVLVISIIDSVHHINMVSYYTESRFEKYAGDFLILYTVKLQY